MSQSALQLFVDRLLRRSELSRTDQQRILDLPSNRLRLDNSRDAVVPGRRVNHALLVTKGWAARFDQLANGCREIVAVYVPGDMCDLHSVVAPLPGWGIQALRSTEFLQVPHAALRNLVDTSPEIAKAFWRDTTADASILAKWVCNRGRRQAIRRIAHLFCELAIRSEGAKLGSRAAFDLPITQAQLAEMLGITAVHTNRVLQSLRQTNVVSTQGDRVSICSWDQLVHIAEFDPAYLLLEKQNSRPAQDWGGRIVTACE